MCFQCTLKADHLPLQSGCKAEVMHFEEANLKLTHSQSHRPVERKTLVEASEMLVVNLCYEQEKKKTKGAYLFGLAGGDDKSGRDEKE